MNIAGRKVTQFSYVDDTLEVFNTHFVGALVGGIETGLFTTSKGCAAFGLTNPGGAIDDNGKQVWLVAAHGCLVHHRMGYCMDVVDHVLHQIRSEGSVEDDAGADGGWRLCGPRRGTIHVCTLQYQT
jgi:ammonia channel protein AmtB